jgi:hypothetical protein
VLKVQEEQQVLKVMRVKLVIQELKAKQVI